MATVDHVREFHKAFGHPADVPANTGGVGDCGWAGAEMMHIAKDLRRLSKGADGAARESGAAMAFLRMHLALEELAEMAEALADGDQLALLDALADRQYVLDGDYLAFGMDGVKEAAIKEVHRSNMSKLVNGRPVLNAAGRVMKPDTYSPADLRPILEEACGSSD